MLSLVIAVFGVIVTILLVIGVHEFGHFIVARLCGIKVLRFSLGFGKSLLSWRDKSGTEYVVAAIPLGGYIKMVDENEENVSSEDLPYSFNRQPLYKRLAVVIAGPLFNLIFAALIYWIIFMIGFSSIKPIIGTVTPDSIAAMAGLKPQQEIVQIDHQPVTSWYNAILKILLRTGETNSMQMETRALKSNTSEVYSLDLSHWHLDELRPDPLDSLGIVPYEPVIPAEIDMIQPDSPATRAGLKVGDKVIALDKLPIKNWLELVTKISAAPGKTVSLTIIRQGKSITIPVTIGKKHKFLSGDYGFLGIGPKIEPHPELIRDIQYGPIAAIPHAYQQTEDFIYLNIMIIGKMLTGKISIKSLGGPITIFESAGTAVNQGLIPFLSFLAFLSISIGMINVLPIPGLDGGHVLFQLIEFVMRRPLSQAAQVLFYRLGLILLLVLIVQALANDLMRI